jgi:hypothetical protein
VTVVLVADYIRPHTSITVCSTSLKHVPQWCLQYISKHHFNGHTSNAVCSIPSNNIQARISSGACSTSLKQYPSTYLVLLQYLPQTTYLKNFYENYMEARIYSGACGTSVNTTSMQQPSGAVLKHLRMVFAVLSLTHFTAHPVLPSYTAYNMTSCCSSSFKLLPSCPSDVA